MKVLPIVAVVLVGAVSSSARPERPDAKTVKRDCMQTAGSQGALNQCAANKARDADRKLNASYRAALCYVPSEERDKFIAAQRAWLAFRDADCRVWGGGDGSIAPMNYALCVASLSDQRAEELDGWPPNASRDAIVGSCRK